MRKKTPTTVRLDDAALLSVTLLAVALTLVGGGVIESIVGAAHPNSLLASLGNTQVVSVFYGAFVILCAILVLLGIGGPALVSTFRAIARKEVVGQRALALGVAVLALPMVPLLPGLGSGAAMLVLLVAAARGAEPPGLAAPAKALPYTSLAQLIGLCALLYFARIAALGEDPGFALAPTALVTSAFFSWTSLWITFALVLAGGGSAATTLAVMAVFSILPWATASRVDAGTAWELASFAFSIVVSAALAVSSWRRARALKHR